MFDTMTLTKIVGGFCGSLLVFLLGGWAAEAIYHVGGGHGDEHAQAYTIPVEDSGEGEVEEEGPAFEEVFASADAGAGERVFGKCRACHNIDGSNATGPHLDGVVDREVGAVAGFNYSGALSEHFDVWTPENLSTFLQNPRGTASGTTMSFAGLSSIEDRANVIAYLQSVGG
ncbi:cytochrome c [Palleronia marisminoris]|uniref:Cytochrome c-552 n=1 Tax=Palleronia marisminoris TaxID=315423 RepID=A0A1Y5SGN2_9RHOB|nr:c-type cytochrome [Palleronia marisminoris]SFG82097.1 cytochrome c [Palleronia marisminoris]SLN40435.1 Cytochrome c-552 [Palleronia marisminoris]